MFRIADILPWLEKHMLACPSKKWLHIECPGCGFQRSMLALFRGELGYSLALYPATIPLLGMLLYLALHVKYKFVNGGRNLKFFQLICGVIILINYIVKIINQN